MPIPACCIKAKIYAKSALLKGWLPQYALYFHLRRPSKRNQRIKIEFRSKIQSKSKIFIALYRMVATTSNYSILVIPSYSTVNCILSVVSRS